MTGIRMGCAIAVLGLAACGQSTAPATSSSAPTTTTAAASDTSAPSQRLALVPATVTGAWSFDGTCASEDGMTIRPDGKAAVGERQEGLWGIDSEGRLVLLMQNFEPGDLTNTAGGGAAEFYAFELRAPDHDTLVSVDATTSQPIHAKRCPPA